MEQKINPEKVEECKKDKLNKTEDCKAILQKDIKKRCPKGRLQKSVNRCRPAYSFCKDSENYESLL